MLNIIDTMKVMGVHNVRKPWLIAAEQYVYEIYHQEHGHNPPLVVAEMHKRKYKVCDYESRYRLVIQESIIRMLEDNIPDKRALKLLNKLIPEYGSLLLGVPKPETWVIMRNYNRYGVPEVIDDCIGEYSESLTRGSLLFFRGLPFCGSESVGKTACMVNCAIHLHMTGKKVAYLSTQGDFNAFGFPIFNITSLNILRRRVGYAPDIIMIDRVVDLDMWDINPVQVMKDLKHFAVVNNCLVYVATPSYTEGCRCDDLEYFADHVISIKKLDNSMVEWNVEKLAGRRTNLVQNVVVDYGVLSSVRRSE